MADCTDYDLTQHEKTSGQDLKYFDQESGGAHVPYVVEPSWAPTGSPWPSH